jgi:putative ABC transport system permease protein
MILRDLRLAFRGLRRSPGFALAAMLTLSLGIGAATTVFSVVYAVLYRPLPFPNADRLVQIVQVLPPRGATGDATRAGLSAAQISEWRATSRTFEEIGGYGVTSAALTGIDVPVRLQGARVSVSLFRALGVKPFAGRLFSPDEEHEGNDRVAILAFTTWREYFGADPGVVTSRVTLNGLPHQVIGIMPEGFGFPSVASPLQVNSRGALDDAPEFWLPQIAAARPDPKVRARGMSLIPTFALIRKGISIDQVTAEANTLMPARPGEQVPVELVTAGSEDTRTIRPVLLLFNAAVAFVLCIAAINVVNLLLARTAHRQQELMVRLALGARPAQLLRAAVAEAVLLAVGGGAIGCGGAFVALAALHRLPPYLLPRIDEVRIDGVVLAFTAMLSVTCGLIIGMTSALQGLRAHWSRPKAHAVAGMAAERQRPLRVLVVTEIAAGMVLFAGAALLLTSFARLMSVDPGFDPSRVLSFRVGLPATRFPSPSSQSAAIRAILEGLHATPGVRAASVSDTPLGLGGVGWPIRIDGQEHQEPVAFREVGPGFLTTVGIPLRHGRDVGIRDQGTPVAVVNEAFARKYLAGENPLGHRVDFQDWAPNLTIVGVFADIRPQRLDRPVDPELYIARAEAASMPAPTFFVQTSGSPAALTGNVRAVVRQVDSSLAVYQTAPLAEVIARNHADAKIYSVTASSFAAVALVLAAIGLYGVLAYSVSARTREVGLRMALGASVRHVLVLVLREALVLTTVGVTMGLAGAWFLSRSLQTLLFGVTSHDPATLGAAAALFVLAAMLAAYLPARRATLIDPVVALKTE